VITDTKKTLQDLNVKRFGFLNIDTLIVEKTIGSVMIDIKNVLYDTIVKKFKNDKKFQ